MDTGLFTFENGPGNVRDKIADELPHLYRYGIHFTKSRTSGEDLAHRTVIRALEAEHLYNEGTCLRAWLFVIMRNIFYNDCRQATVHNQRLLQVSRVLSNEVQLPDQLHRVEFSEHARGMARLSKDHPEMHQAVYLIGVEGLSYQEASEVAGVPSGTIKSRVARGRDALAKGLRVKRPKLRRHRAG